MAQQDFDAMIDEFSRLMDEDPDLISKRYLKEKAFSLLVEVAKRVQGMDKAAAVSYPDYWPNSTLEIKRK